MARSVKTENQTSAEEYLMVVWKKVSELMMPLTKSNRSGWTSQSFKFDPYTEQEERRLRSSLKRVSYEIDDLGTLDAVIGPGRVEKVITIDR